MYMYIDICENLNMKAYKGPYSKPSLLQARKLSALPIEVGLSAVSSGFIRVL